MTCILINQANAVVICALIVSGVTFRACELEVGQATAFRLCANLATMTTLKISIMAIDG